MLYGANQAPMSREGRASDVAHQEMQAREKQKCRGASRGKGGPLPACFSSTTVLYLVLVLYRTVCL